MSDFARVVLRMLRVFGPCSNADIARRLQLPLHKTYRELYLLCEAGLAVHPKLQRWDISRLGREWFEKQPGNPLALFDFEPAMAAIGPPDEDDPDEDDPDEDEEESDE